jgi:phosphatidylinositol alpha-mannosyltransferase
VQQYVLTLGAWLAAQGHTVHYITASTDREDLTNLHVISRTVKVTFNGNQLGTPRPVSRAAARALVGSLGLDVLHVQMPYSPLLAGRVIDAAADAGVAVVGTFHIYPQSWLVAAGARVLGWMERRRLRKFSQVIAVSEAAQDFARTAFGIETRVIGNPVDIAAFTPPFTYDDAARSDNVPAQPAADDATQGDDMAQPSTRVTSSAKLVFLGRLVERKGPRQLVAALGRLHADRPELAWTAVIAGRGPMLDDLQRSGADDGIVDRLEFPGFIAEEDKAALLSSADVVALPSTGGESFGISVVEALAASTGVVLAGDNPGYRTVMRGLEPQLVNPDATETFSAALASWLDALTDSTTRATVTDAQHAAAARFDIHTIGAQVEAVYRDATAPETRPLLQS